MDKLSILRQELQKYKKLCIGFSGGVDSAFLLKVAAEELKEGCIAVICDGIMVTRRDIINAIALAGQIGAKYEIVKLDAMSVNGFVSNDKMRCYYCKRAVFGKIKELADFYGAALADGTNADDAKAYRPGLQAVKELSVVSPLCDAGFTKKEIREYSKSLGLCTWDKPSNACLATRIPYDEHITAEKLSIVEQAEEYLQDSGYIGIRARLHGNLARIEAPPEDFDRLIRDKDIAGYFKQLGFKYITLDLEGFRSGSMD